MTTLPTAISAGLYSALPAFGIAGRLYFATDALRMYRDNGSGWIDITPTILSLAIALPAPSGASSYALPSAPQFPASSLYFLNGQKMTYGVFYSIDGATLKLLTSELPESGDIHELYAS